MSATASLKRIRLNLARSKEHPEGSSACGYELVAPLDPLGRIDPEAWKHARARCTVRRFWRGEAEKIGKLDRRAGGMGGATWVFDYDDTRRDDDEAGYRFGAHAFVPGEYVTLRDQQDSHTFRVAAVDNV